MAQFPLSMILYLAGSFWLLTPPFGFFTFGMLLVFIGMVYTFIGKAYVRFQGWAYRAKEPKRYWGEVVTYYLLGFGMIALFLYEAHWLSK